MLRKTEAMREQRRVERLAAYDKKNFKVRGCKRVCARMRGSCVHACEHAHDGFCMCVCVCGVYYVCVCVCVCVCVVCVGAACTAALARPPLCCAGAASVHVRAAVHTWGDEGVRKEGGETRV